MSESPKETNLTPQSLVSEENVKLALLADKGDEALLKSWEVVDFTKQGDSYACLVSSVEVQYELNNEVQKVVYVVKLNPCRNFQQFQSAVNLLFEKESRFYLELLPELNAALETAGLEPLRHPRCFHSCLEIGKEQIYLEDLRSKDFKMFDRKKGMDIEHAELVIHELARLHAASYFLLSRSVESFFLKHDFLEKDFLTSSESNKEAGISLWQGHLDNAAGMLRKASGYERAVAFIENLKPQVEEILTSGMQSEKFISVNHGDCWNNNILFKYNDEGIPIDVILLDLQISKKASLAADLNYFMFTSLTGEVRTTNTSEFLSKYYNEYEHVIRANGLQMHFTEDDLVKEYRDKNIIGCVWGMIILPFAVMESNEIPDLSKDFDETTKEIKANAMSMMDNNPLLKPRFLAIFDELMETGLIP